VLLVPQDSVAGFFAVMAICALASGVAIRMALQGRSGRRRSGDEWAARAFASKGCASATAAGTPP
jgi:hypothetical protein